MEQQRPLEGVDQAVLAGTALVVIITVNFDQDVWTPFASAIGIVMLLILAAFYRPGRITDRRMLHLRTAAVSAILALCACVAIGWPIQHLDIYYLHLNTFYLKCGNRAFVRAYAEEDGPGNVCAAAQTTSYLLPPLWLLLTAAIYALRTLTRRTPARAATPRATTVPTSTLTPLPVPNPAPAPAPAAAAPAEPRHSTGGSLPAARTAPDCAAPVPASSPAAFEPGSRPVHRVFEP